MASLWKKIVFTSLTATGFLLVSLGMAGAFEMAPLNPDFRAWQERLETAGETKEMFSGEIPIPLDISHLQKAGFRKASDRTYPPRFDLRNLQGKNYITPVKNQGKYGLCWAFASLACIESTLLRGGMPDVPDYSEWDLGYFSRVDQSSTLPAFDYPKDKTFPEEPVGGNIFMAAAILARGTGPVKESLVPYDGKFPHGKEPLATLVKKALFFPFGHLANPERIEGLKYVLTTYGATYVSIRAPENREESLQVWNPKTGAFYYGGNKGTNHAVTVVGWDDGYARNNFATTPPGDGAWIVKNSWGTQWGLEGYFYLSYYDQALFGWGTLVGEPPQNYRTIYQYDPLGMVNSGGYGERETAWGANVFEVGSGMVLPGTSGDSTLQEALRGVSFCAMSLHTKYRIQIYTQVQGAPNTGRLAHTQEGLLELPGYHLISLDRTIPLKNQSKFAVALELTTPNYYNPLSLEYPERGYSDKATAHKGESYISRDGKKWEDLNDSFFLENLRQANLCIKAFTIPHTPPPSGGGSGGCSVGHVFPAGLLLLGIPLMLYKP